MSRLRLLPAMGRRHAPMVTVLLLAAIMTTAWLPFLHAYLGPDEAGFLLLGQQWAPGTSLYGNYWVDRPPLLVWIFSLVGQISPTGQSVGALTAPAVRLLGATASGVSVLLAGLVGSLASPGRRWSPVAGAVVATVLLSSPLFGMPETDGEVLALPFVLLGLVLLIAALRHARMRSGLLLAAGAGGSAMCAALVKQNVVDVFVFAIAVALLARVGIAGIVGKAGAFVGGAIAVLVAALVGAAARGTSPLGLWDAIVVFRLQASDVIGSSSSATTPERMVTLVEAFLASGAAALLVVTVSRLLVQRYRRRQPRVKASISRAGGALDLTWPVLLMVAWELVAAALGGSYWLHYLTGLVPGLVLLGALVDLPAPGRRRVLVGVCLAGAAVVNAGVWVDHVAAPLTVSDDSRVVSYLREHEDRSDGVVVAFGHPDIVAASGLASPYPQLWSLPVRVRDPQLDDLEQVMSGPAAPRWMVVAGASLDTWGVDAPSAQDYLEQHYGEQVSYGDWHVWQRLEGVPR